MTDMEMDLIIAQTEAATLRLVVKEYEITIANQKNHIDALQRGIEDLRKQQQFKKCNFGEGVSIKPDGVNELDPCMYEVLEVHENVTVEVLRCKKCGHTEVSWYRPEDGESNG